MMCSASVVPVGWVGNLRGRCEWSQVEDSGRSAVWLGIVERL